MTLSSTNAVIDQDRNNFLSLLTHLPGLAYRCLNDTQWTMLYVSEGCFDLTGYQPEDLVENRTIAFEKLIHPDDSKYVWEEVQKAIREKRKFRMTYRIHTASGELKWVWEQGMATPYHHPKGQVLEGFITDISENFQAHERIQHLNKVLLAIRDVNQLIVKEKKLDHLLQKSCTSLVKTRGYVSAWIILLNEQGQVEKYAKSGIDNNFPLLIKLIKKGKTPAIIKEVLNHSHVFKIDDAQEIYPDASRKFIDPCYSLLSRRILHKSKIYGLLSVMIPRSMINDQEEQELFHEVVDDIGFAIYSIELNRKRQKMERELRATEERFVYIFNNAGDGIIFIGKNGIVKEINPILLQFTGVDREDIVGKHSLFLVEKYFDPKNQKKIKSKLEKLLAGIKIDPFELEFADRKIEVSVPQAQTTQGFTGIVRDITERKKAEIRIKESLKEKELLIQEIHHRVKNNLQIIRSLIDLQSGQIHDEKALEVLSETKSRVQAMALVHERAYQSEHFIEIQFKNYIETMVDELFHTYEITGRITLVSKIEDIGISIDNAIPCGLIINELITNSLRHAFPDQRMGTIDISMRTIDHEVKELIVRDDGVGIPAHIHLENANSLGLTLIKILTKQLNGTVVMDRTNGTGFTIRFRGIGR
jgi:PAS domain S-box-containing protein